MYEETKTRIVVNKGCIFKRSPLKIETTKLYNWICASELGKATHLIIIN